MPNTRLGALALLSLLAPLAFPAPPAPPAPAQPPGRVEAVAEAVRLNNLGVATMNQQKFEPALAYFQKAAAADPSLVQARLNEAIALLSLQRFEPARAALKAVIDARPSYARAWYNLGLLQKGLGETEDGLVSFRRATELAPRDANSHYFVGLLAAQLQQYEPAIGAFTKALEIDPFHVSAEFGLARACQRAGQADRARTHMERFTRLTTAKLATPMSLAYGDQGPLSLAEAALPPAGAARPAIAVTFESGANDAGGPGLGAQPGVGPGLCAADFDGDSVTDLVVAGPTGALLHRGQSGRFPATATLATGPATGCAAGDVDNDEIPDLAVGTATGVQLWRNEGKGVFVNVTAQAGLPATGSASLGLSFVDYDHDADLDLLVPRSHVWRNNGNGTFTDVAAERGLVAPGGVAVTASDLDNDRAIDLVFSGASPAALLNPREGPFNVSATWSPAPPAASEGVLALDFDKDGWMDLAFTHRGTPALSLWRNTGGRSFEQITLPDVGPGPLFGLTSIDYDNDGWIDLAAGGGDAKGRLVVLRNADGRWAHVSAAVGAGALTLVNPRALVAFDVDADGDADLVVGENAGSFRVVRNNGGNKNGSVRIALKGLNDNRSAFGVKVEVQAGAIWQKFETASSAGYLGQGPAEILAGIGEAREADVVRLLWPTGVVQDEIQLASGQRHEVVQVDRRGSSCPVLFAWDGTRFEFVADAIGPAVVGHWVAPGRRNVPDADEFVKVDGRLLRPRDGRLSLRFAEPMEEVIYLDQVRLVAVDHPVGTDVNPNEYFAAVPPHPAERVIASAAVRLPAGAWDERGRDLLPALRARDRQFADAFASEPFKGFAKLHAVELDLGELRAGAPLRLLMHGFTDYFTATSVFAASQANVSPVVPYVEALGRDGRWTRVADDIGFPAGLLRTMTADLTGRLPAGTRRIRIWTNLKVYWDQILIDQTPEGAVPTRQTTVPLLSASLAFRGFPREVPGTPAADLRYVYDEVSRFGPYARHRGFYTRYGDVTPLVGRAEDRFVVFGAGDEVALEFDATALGAVPDGWTRDYLVYFRGYVKDMDFYAAHGQTVDPLPFAAMPGYPYPPSVTYPDGLREYRLEWNTREVASEGWASYRFEY